METKSRYEVIADLEKQKRDLIREKDKIDDDIKVRERVVKNLERTKEDISKFTLPSGSKIIVYDEQGRYLVLRGDAKGITPRTGIRIKR